VPNRGRPYFLMTSAVEARMMVEAARRSQARRCHSRRCHLSIIQAAYPAFRRAWAIVRREACPVWQPGLSQLHAVLPRIPVVRRLRKASTRAAHRTGEFGALARDRIHGQRGTSISPLKPASPPARIVGQEKERYGTRRLRSQRSLRPASAESDPLRPLFQHIAAGNWTGFACMFPAAL